MTKAKEITQASGKTWMYDKWMENGFSPEVNDDGKEIYKDIWRLEIRLRSKWLKNRGMNFPDTFLENQKKLFSEVLYQRRLTRINQRDSHRYRWPLHPLYTLALGTIDNPPEFVPMGRTITERPEVIIETMLKGIAGTCRTAQVLLNRFQRGAFDEDEARKFFDKAVRIIFDDPDHQKKIEKSMDIYRFVDEAK